jgi:hypothetical protein
MNMKTDDLIAVLSTNVEPVDTRRVAWNVWAAILAGMAAALATAVFGLGVRPDLHDPDRLAFVSMKLAFGMAVAGLASVYLLKHIRPGGEFRSWLALTTLPFLASMLLAVVTLSSAPRSHWKMLMLGGGWLECLLAIPIIAVLPFAVIMWAVRLAAPTDLTRTGALAGLVAGGVSATAYALHCIDDSLPFVALWYGGTVALCTVTGAALGPRLLRW